MSTIFRPFDGLTFARFVSRPNRFMVKCVHEGRPVDAFLPNPGRLQELLLPGSLLYLTEEEAQGSRKMAHTVVAVERDGLPVMLHTHKTNAAARYLIEKRLVPGLEDAAVERSEVAVGHSRFDFLLKDGKGEVLLEVKSCTLFGKRVAMFPDAVTARGARHLQELSALSRSGRRAAVLFVVHWPRAKVFMPDYHTDLHFARTLLAVRESVGIIPVAVRWQPDLSLASEATLLDIPWPYIERETHDRGSYILVLELGRTVPCRSAREVKILFRKGFYLYVGSAMANLTQGFKDTSGCANGIIGISTGSGRLRASMPSYLFVLLPDSNATSPMPFPARRNGPCRASGVRTATVTRISSPWRTIPSVRRFSSSFAVFQDGPIRRRAVVDRRLERWAISLYGVVHIMRRIEKGAGAVRLALVIIAVLAFGIGAWQAAEQTMTLGGMSVTVWSQGADVG